MFYKVKPLCLILLLPLATLLLFGCANVVSPQGGPVDEDPPQVINSTPPNFSTNYDGQDIRIFFDEYIELHNLRQQMLISPPLEKTPETQIRRRSIIMSIEEELMDNTTYNFFFGNAIRDITERNAIDNFQFVVSTGDYVDSLSVRGEVIHAFDLEPAEDVYVMMYDNVYDSVPYKEMPSYISRTCEEGKFEIKNMQKGEYLMFALKDLNFNYIFDLPDEKIAFIDSLVVPEYVRAPTEPKRLDTVPGNGDEFSNAEEENDMEQEEPSAGEPIDKATQENNDSVNVFNDTHATFYTLHLFQEEDTVQRISSANYSMPGKIIVEFRIPYDSAYVKEYKTPFSKDQKIKEFSKDKKSLSIWLDDVNRDSLFLEVWDQDHLIDSIEISLIPRESRQRRESVEPELTITSNTGRGHTFSYFMDFVLEANNPVKSVDTTQIEVFKNDSIPVDCSWKLFGTTGRKIKFDKTFEQETKYSFVFPDSTFTDIFALANKDTLNISFTTTHFSNYGTILLDLTLPREPADGEKYMLQLLNSRQEVQSEKIITRSDQYKFVHLKPAEYSFKIIHDKNNNGKWDTGNYLKGIQPEPVYLMDENIVVRQNWDHEVIWNVVP